MNLRKGMFTVGTFNNTSTASDGTMSRFPAVSYFGTSRHPIEIPPEGPVALELSQSNVAVNPIDISTPPKTYEDFMEIYVPQEKEWTRDYISVLAKVI